MKKDLNQIAAIEIAIKKKYGAEAIANPLGSWTPEKEKEYLKQLFYLYIDFFNPRQLGKYCLVGSLGVIINFAILIGLTEAFGFHYIVSEAFAIGVVLISNFILNKHWTFKV